MRAKYWRGVVYRGEAKIVERFSSIICKARRALSTDVQISPAACEHQTSTFCWGYASVLPGQAQKLVLLRLCFTCSKRAWIFHGIPCRTISSYPRPLGWSNHLESNGKSMGRSSGLVDEWETSIWKFFHINIAHQSGSTRVTLSM